MNIPLPIFCQHVTSAGSVFMVSFGLAKSLLFGLLVGVIGCGAGMRTEATADGVGKAATSAVVGGMVAIAIADGTLAAVCYAWGL
jgi:phospholipid/cholesterol/gamma-HCH transport system permease protein